MSTFTKIGHIDAEDLSAVVDGYTAHFEDKDASESAEARREKDYKSITKTYYDLATDFYEYGWGESFHFSARYPGEHKDVGILRLEHFIADKLQLGEGMSCLDLGCGVGGPARHIAAHSKAHVTGVNMNAYQIDRARKHTSKANLSHLVEFVEADFMHMPFEDNSFDAAYAFEAVCHAPDKVKFFENLFRILKPGGVFAVSDWAMTPQYNSSDESERAIKWGIEQGDGIANLEVTTVWLDALRTAGFEVVETEDLADTQRYGTIPWYEPLEGSWWGSGLRHTSVGRFITHYMVGAMEMLGIAPAGSQKISGFLCTAADNLVAGGRKKIFTPMFFFKVRKPLSSGSSASAARKSAASTTASSTPSASASPKRARSPSRSRSASPSRRSKSPARKSKK